MTARRWSIGAAVIAVAVAPATMATAEGPDDQAVDPSPTAEAPPVPPAPIGYIQPLSTIGSILAQTGSEPAGPLGLPDLSTYGPTLLLGQNPAPSVPGTAEQAVVPSLAAFTDEYLVPLNLAPAAPGEGSPAPGIGPNAAIPDDGRIALLRRLRQMYQAGNLTGALLGQLPKD